MIRYNNLLVVIKRTLRDLLKALKGLVVMSEALEKMFNSLYNNTVPQLWANKVSNVLFYTCTCTTVYTHVSCIVCFHNFYVFI